MIYLICYLLKCIQVEIVIYEHRLLLFIFNFKTREVRQTFLNNTYKPKKEMKIESSTESSQASSDASDTSGDTSGESSTEYSGPDTPATNSLEDQIQISIGNIQHDLNRYYYTDEAYAQGQAIVAEYEEKISAAKSPEEAQALENEAMGKLSEVPRSTTPV